MAVSSNSDVLIKYRTDISVWWLGSHLHGWFATSSYYFVYYCEDPHCQLAGG